ncbi:hypothetical protein BBSC_0667 [Bifidobacterium scardovii JCM 12489 = DSM 13734]|nr:hypothetical protein BBSC_0667 [Bifidobacterium scardovii JCM 12489 = DSM 13734]
MRVVLTLSRRLVNYARPSKVSPATDHLWSRTLFMHIQRIFRPRGANLLASKGFVLPICTLAGQSSQPLTKPPSSNRLGAAKRQTHRSPAPPSPYRAKQNSHPIMGAPRQHAPQRGRTLTPYQQRLTGRPRQSNGHNIQKIGPAEGMPSEAELLPSNGAAPLIRLSTTTLLTYRSLAPPAYFPAGQGS